MMKMLSKILLCPSVLVIIGCSRIDQEKEKVNHSTLKVLTDLESIGLKGKVKYLKQEECNMNSNGSLGNRTGEESYVLRFNLEGLKTGDNRLNDQGFFTEFSKYSFDNSQRKSSKIITNIKGKQISKSTFEYDDFGRLIKLNIKDNKKGISFYNTYKYDKKGNEIAEYTWSTDGQIIKGAETKYLNNAKSIITLKDRTGIPYAISKKKNNLKGDPILESIYFGNGVLNAIFTSKYTYDDRGNWIMKKYTLKDIGLASEGAKKSDIGKTTITLRTIQYY